MQLVGSKANFTVSAPAAMMLSRGAENRAGSLRHTRRTLLDMSDLDPEL